MLMELFGNIALRIIGIFISKAEEKAAWEKAIRQRLREIDASAQDSAKLHMEYDRLQTELKQPRKETP